MPLSKGAQKLKKILCEVYGSHVRIIEELQLGQGLRLDFYLPDYGVGFEYHGRQHREFVEHFHKDAAGFRASQYRDSLKYELCAQQDIALAVVWYDQELTKELILSAASEALSSFVPMEAKKVSKAKESDEYRKARLAKAKEARRERYLWQKQRKRDLKKR